MGGPGLPARPTLSPGRGAAVTHADAPAVVIAGGGYDEQALVDAFEAKGGEADADRHEDRGPVGRLRAGLEQSRRVATRYGKTARNFRAFVQVVSTMTLLRQPFQSGPHGLAACQGSPHKFCRLAPD